jgi:hypothetical protein
MCRVHLNRRQRLLVSFIVLAVVSVSVMTLAFFRSNDEVSNRVHSKAMQVSVLEPNWESTGVDLAKQSVPGTLIPKDPQVKNLSGSPVYVRVSLEVVPSDAATSTAILKSLRYYDADATDSNPFKESLEFGEDGTVLGLLDPASKFYYYDGYYYYGTVTETDGAKTAALTSLGVGETTPSLFDAVLTPADETYTTYFSQGFRIKVSVEGVYADAEVKGSLKEVAEVF